MPLGRVHAWEGPARAVSWNAARDEYLAEKLSKLKPRTHADYTYILNRHFKYATTKLTELSPHDLRQSLERLKATPGEQQHAFVIVRAFLRWAHRQHYLDRNPMERMQAPHSYIPRERILTNDELTRVWHAARDDTFGKIVKLLSLTGQRRGEITQLTGAMVGEGTITLPSWLAKNSRQHMFPLGRMANTILTPRRPSETLFFPALGRATPFNGWSKCKPKLEKRSGITDWTLHDLRRTFASGLASIGVQLPVIERLLNHVSGSFGGIVGFINTTISSRRCRTPLRDGKIMFRSSYRTRDNACPALLRPSADVQVFGVIHLHLYNIIDLRT